MPTRNPNGTRWLIWALQNAAALDSMKAQNTRSAGLSPESMISMLIAEGGKEWKIWEGTVVAYRMDAW